MPISKARNRDYHAFHEAALEARGTPQAGDKATLYTAHRLMLEAAYDFDALRDDVDKDGNILKGQAPNTIRQMVSSKTGRPFETMQAQRRREEQLNDEE